MDDYIKRLRQYVEANPILFDGEWDHPAMDSLYWHYNESHYIQYTIKGRIMDYSDCTIDVRTVQGDIRLTPGDIKDLLDNEVEHIRIGDETIPAKDFLMQDADRIQRDLFNPGVYRLITNEAFEMQEHPIEYSEPTANDSQQM